MSRSFPVFPVGTLFRPFSGKVGKLSDPADTVVEVDYPHRLNGMTIDSAGIALEGKTSFPAGEICFSIDKFVHVKLKTANKLGLIIDKTTERKSIVKHACLIMSKALNVRPDFNISVTLDDGIKKHSGFGSSGAIIGAVCVAINELYGNPVEKLDLIKYMADNYGEEVSDDDEDNLKLVQCVGGSVGNGLTDGAITIMTGNATPIVSKKYDAKILVAIPKDFHPKSAKEMMELEEDNLNNFISHGERYAYEIAYNLIHEGMPLLKNGDISGICKIIYRHRFEMGSIRNCSFVYPKIMDIADSLKYLYEKSYCRLLSMSSVGPALFLILNKDKEQTNECKEALSKLNLEIISASLYNEKYKVKIIERKTI